MNNSTKINRLTAADKFCELKMLLAKRKPQNEVHMFDASDGPEAIMKK